MQKHVTIDHFSKNLLSVRQEIKKSSSREIGLKHSVCLHFLIHLFLPTFFWSKDIRLCIYHTKQETCKFFQMSSWIIEKILGINSTTSQITHKIFFYSLSFPDFFETFKLMLTLTSWNTFLEKENLWTFFDNKFKYRFIFNSFEVFPNKKEKFCMFGKTLTVFRWLDIERLEFVPVFTSSFLYFFSILLSWVERKFQLQI